MEEIKNSSHEQTVMAVGTAIRRLRLHKGLTQKELGELCSIAEPTIRRYELGLLNPKYQTLAKIADALSVEADILIKFGIKRKRFETTGRYSGMTVSKIHEMGLITDDTEIFIRDKDFKLIAHGNWYEDKMLEYSDTEAEGFSWQDDNKIFIDLRQ